MRKTGFALTLASTMVVAIGLAGCGGGGGNDNNNPGSTRVQTGRASVTAVRGIRGAAVRLQVFGGGGSGKSVKIPTRAAFAKKVTRQNQPREYDEDYGLWSEFVMESQTSSRTNYYTEQFGGESAGSISTSFTSTGIRFVFDVTGGLEPSRGEMVISKVSETSGNLRGDVEDLATNEVTRFDLDFQQVGTDQFGEPLYQITGDMFYRDDQGAEFAYNNLIINPDGSIAADVVEEGLQGHVVMNADGSGTFTLNAEDGQYICQWDDAGRGFIQYPDGFREDISDYDTFDEDEHDFGGDFA